MHALGQPAPAAPPIAFIQPLTPKTQKGEFMMVLSIYWPKDEALTGKWTAPPLQRVK